MEIPSINFNYGCPKAPQLIEDLGLENVSLVIHGWNIK